MGLVEKLNKWADGVFAKPVSTEQLLGALKLAAIRINQLEGRVDSLEKRVDFLNRQNTVHNKPLVGHRWRAAPARKA